MHDATLAKQSRFVDWDRYNWFYSISNCLGFEIKGRIVKKVSNHRWGLKENAITPYNRFELEEEKRTRQLKSDSKLTRKGRRWRWCVDGTLACTEMTICRISNILRPSRIVQVSWGYVRAKEMFIWGILRLRILTGSDVINPAIVRYFTLFRWWANDVLRLLDRSNWLFL